jgi:hypothetical protein
VAAGHHWSPAPLRSASVGKIMWYLHVR